MTYVGQPTPQASGVWVMDSSGYYVSTNVEDALKESYENKFPMNTSRISGCVVSDDGTLDISWTAGIIYDLTNKQFVSISSGSGTCTNNLINYLYWTAGSTLSISTTEPSGNDVTIAHVYCQSNDIFHVMSLPVASATIADIREALDDIIPTIVVNGLLVSEDTDITNVWDVVMDSGIFYHLGIKKHTIAASVYSRTVNMYRWYHSGGTWTYGTNAEIDITQYDDGTNLVAVSAGKYHKSVFFTDDTNIHWVYPQEEFNTVAEAVDGALPTLPSGLEELPVLTAVVIKTGDAAFPVTGSDQWIDARPRLGAGVSGAPITDHGLLAGLTGDDHLQYSRTDGTRAITGMQAFTHADAGMLDLNPANTGTQNVIDITPSAAIGAAAIWKGLYINGASLDPSGAGADVLGIHLDLWNVDLTNNPNLYGIYIAMPAVYGGAGTEVAGYFSGDGRLVQICSDSYALNVTGATNLVGAVTGITGITMSGAIATPTTITTSGLITSGAGVTSGSTAAGMVYGMNAMLDDVQGGMMSIANQAWVMLSSNVYYSAGYKTYDDDYSGWLLKIRSETDVIEFLWADGIGGGTTGGAWAGAVVASLSSVGNFQIDGDLTAANIITAGNVDGVDVAGLKTSYDAHLHDTQTLLCDGINSDGGAFSFTTTGIVSFNRELIINANYIQVIDTGHFDNPYIQIGSSVTNDFIVQTVYNVGTNSLDYVKFQSRSSAAGDGRMKFYPDGVLALTLYPTGNAAIEGSLTIGGADIHTVAGTDFTVANGGVIYVGNALLGFTLPSGDANAYGACRFQVPATWPGTTGVLHIVVAIEHASNTFSWTLTMKSIDVAGQLWAGTQILNDSGHDITGTGTSLEIQIEEVAITNMAAGDTLSMRFTSNAANANALYVLGAYLEVT